MLVLNWKRLVNGEFTNKSMLINNVNEELLPSSVVAAIKLVNSNPSVAILSTWMELKHSKSLIFLNVKRDTDTSKHQSVCTNIHKHLLCVISETR